MGGIEFLEPQRLWLLLVVVALASTYLASQARRRRYAVRFTNLALLDKVAPKRPGWRRHLPALFLLAALATMVGAFAQPARPTRVPRERATIIMAIDTSLSMEATDVEPNRLKAAQAAANQFIDLLPARLNVGLVTFNGIAKVAVPPTQNREELHAAVDQLRLGERTAIGEAIYASLDAIGVDTSDPDEGGTGTSTTPQDGTADPEADDEDAVPARIVLMSDGSTTVGRPDAQAAAAAERAGVPVYTIAFGTPYGTINIEGEEGPISVAVNPEALALIADATGGKAFTASTGTELKSVYENIGSSIGYTTVQKDVTTTFVGSALVLLLVASVLSQLWFRPPPLTARPFTSAPTDGSVVATDRETRGRDMAVQNRKAARIATAVALTVGLWLATPASAAQARPAQVVVEYGATLEAGAKATEQGMNAKEQSSGVGDKIGDLVDKGKENSALAVILIGLVAVTGTWKVISR